MIKPFRIVVVRVLSGSILSLSLLLAGCASDSFGVAAYKRGEFTTALTVCRADRSPEGDFALGLMYYKGKGVNRDPKEAALYFRRSAEQGHAGAQFNIGLMRLNGRWIKKDLKKAAYWFHLSAAQDNSLAQYNLGLMFARGDGVRKDRRKAVGWLARSAHQGNSQALAKLKVLLADGAWKQS